jgi:hypothetical protein
MYITRVCKIRRFFCYNIYLRISLFYRTTEETMKIVAENKKIKRLGRHYQLFDHKPAEQERGWGQEEYHLPPAVTWTEYWMTT